MSMDTTDSTQYIQMTDKNEICGRWILEQKEAQTGCPAPGTTFPPFSNNLPYYKEMLSMSTSMDYRHKCKCLSEADLTKLQQSASFQESSDCNTQDEDHLFEFDIGSPAGDVGNDDLGSELDSNIVFNVIEREGVRTFSISSDSSSSCTHRNEKTGSTDGFPNIFGSVPSGFDSGRRSYHGEGDGSEEDEKLEGLPVALSSWKESCALLLASKDDRETNARTPAEGSATPILAVSPRVVSPVVSPDSCLDEESILDDQNLCIECASSYSFPVQNEEIPTPVENDSDSNDYPRTEEVFKISSPTPQPERVEINAGLHVSTDKLKTLLKQLEVDKLYPYREEDDIFCATTQIQCHETAEQRSKLKKCSSLKTSRTPLVASELRKVVRFADALGLDLSEVKTFSDEIPIIPRAAFDDLDVIVSDYETGSPISKHHFLPNPTPAVDTTTSLVPMFNQPGGEPRFLETVMVRKICLENAFMDSPSAISGVVRVANISFQKSVTVKWTVDDWRTVTETSSEYMKDSSKGNTDKFSFKLVVGSSLPVGSRLQFCLKYNCEGEHWDSNGGVNYAFQVFLNSSSKSLPIAKPTDFGSGNYSRQIRVPFPSHSPSQHGDDPWLRFM